MNDQSRYIVDSRYFDGTCLTFMTDGFRSDFGGETLEEMRVDSSTEAYLFALLMNKDSLSCAKMEQETAMSNSKV